MSPNTSTVRPIVIGKKDVPVYVAAIVMRRNAGEAVMLRARGELIGKMVDVANLAINIGLPVTRGEMTFGVEEKSPGVMIPFAQVTLNGTTQTKSLEGDRLIIGAKPVTNYMVAIQTRVANGQKTLVLRARGKNISGLIDVINQTLKIGLPIEKGQVFWSQECDVTGRMVSFVECAISAKVQ